METRERENPEIRVVNQTENQITRRAQQPEGLLRRLLSSSESVSARGRKEDAGLLLLRDQDWISARTNSCKTTARWAQIQFDRPLQHPA